MLIFRIAVRNLIRRGRKTVVVALLIAVGVAAFFLGNAVLESSIGGIQRTFSDNFTADLSINAHSDQSFSLFGPDIPVIGDYETTPLIVNALDVGARAARVRGVAATAYVLSSPVLLEAGGARIPGLGIGAIGDEYFSLFRAPLFTVGAPPAPGSSGWAVITEECAAEIEAAQGHPLAIGDPLKLSLFRNQTFTIREARLAGVIRYQPGNAALKHVVIADGRILRALCGYSQADAAGISASPSAPQGQAADLDSLFSGSGGTSASGTPTQESAPISMEELKNLLNEAHRAGTKASESALGHDGPWHFILVRTLPGESRARIAGDLRRDLETAGLSVQVRDWRGTAGGVATYVFLMQIVLYVGIFMLAGIVLILTMNSLVMSVFERTAEIGTMRAIGARRGFVQSLFIVETCIMTLASGIAGVLLGIMAVGLLDRISLQFRNQILVLLFGGASLHPGISGGNIVVSIIAAFVLGLIAWVYPVRLALRIQPVRAIRAS
jgi:putative ABC transport system permease protein